MTVFRPFCISNQRFIPLQHSLLLPDTRNKRRFVCCAVGGIIDLRIDGFCTHSSRREIVAVCGDWWFFNSTGSEGSERMYRQSEWGGFDVTDLPWGAGASSAVGTDGRGIGD